MPLDEIAREGARRMLIKALRAEAADYVERHRGERDEHGHTLVVHTLVVHTLVVHTLVVRSGRAQAR